MATTLSTQELLQILPQPRIYEIGDDTEEFLNKMESYFSMIRLDNAQRNIVIRAYLSEAAREKFDKTSEDDYVPRIRNAFEGKTNLADDLDTLLNYRRGDDSVETFIAKVEKNVEKVMKHKLTSTKLIAFFLKHCLDKEEQKKEIERFEMTEDLLKAKLNKDDLIKDVEGETRGPTQTKYIKKILIHLDQKSDEQNVNAIGKQSYADVAKRKHNFNEFKRNIGKSSDQYKDRNNFQNQNRQGYYQSIRRNQYPTQNQMKSNHGPQCYGCYEFGHIRRNCPNIRCSLCGLNGHLRFRCRSGLIQNQRSMRFWNKAENPSRSDYPKKHDNRVAALFDDGISKTDEDEISGNVEALNKGELIGALNLM